MRVNLLESKQPMNMTWAKMIEEEGVYESTTYLGLRRFIVVKYQALTVVLHLNDNILSPINMESNSWDKEKYLFRRLNETVYIQVK